MYFIHQESLPGSNSRLFKNYRNLFNTVVRASKKLYFETQLQKNSSNLKKTWQLINSAIKKPAKNSKITPEIYINNVLESDPKTVANHFNKFFSTAALNIVKDINPCDRPPDDTVPLNPVTFSLSKEPVTASEISEACKLLEPKKVKILMVYQCFLSRKSYYQYLSL